MSSTPDELAIKGPMTVDNSSRGGASRSSRRRRARRGGSGGSNTTSNGGSNTSSNTGSNTGSNTTGRGSQKKTKVQPPLTLDELIERMAANTPIQPIERLRLETLPDEVIGRIVDIISPIGKGQRCLVTSPPKAGKTTILQAVARAVAKNHPEVRQIALLIDERPEEATDFRRNVPVEVIASTSDQTAKQHVLLAEEVFRTAITAMLDGHDVLILLDSITRLARAYNNIAGSGKILSGGVTAGALDRPRQLFGSARKLEEGGSLTIVATALVDTNSVMDEVIFQEFKGTGNLELILDRELSQRRFFPAVHINPSGTRREMDLLNEQERVKVPALRRQLAEMSKEESLNWLIKRIRKTTSNKELLGSVNTSS